MFRKITVLAAALATTATLALAAGPANAARSIDHSGEDMTFSAEPTGTHVMEHDAPPKNYESDDEYEGCQDKLKAANAWLNTAREAWARGLPAIQAQAESNADKVAGDANANGCTLIQPE